MSLQNLLEMDDLNNSQPSRSSVGSRTNALPPKALPRPLPRSSRIPRLGTTGRSSTFTKEPRAIDNVMSFSEETSPTKQAKRTVAFTTTNSFDNGAFITDEGSSFDHRTSPQAPKPRQRPQPLENQEGKDFIGGETSSWFSSGKQENHHISKIDKLSDNFLDNDYANDEDNSSATFTIENEKPETLTKKPPKPLKRRQRSVVRGETTTSADEPSYHDGNSDDYEKTSGSPTPISGRKTKDHSSIEIEADGNPNKPDGNIGNDNDYNDDKDKGNGVSSVGANENTAKQSSVKKSRFGKLFSTSLSSENKNKSTSDTAHKIAKSGEDGGSVDGERELVNGGGKGGVKDTTKQSIVNRWKKTFSRTGSSKNVRQEEEEMEELQMKDETKKKTSGKERDTRIFMPEDSEGDSQDGEVMEMEGKESKMSQRISNVPSSENEKELEETKDVKTKKSSKLKPLAKLVISKNKERSQRKQQERRTKDPVVAQFSEKKPGKGARQDELEVETKGEKKKTPVGEKEDEVQLSASSFSSSASEDEENFKKEKRKGKLEVKKQVSRDKRKLKKEQRETVPIVDSATGKDLLFGVTIHSSDLLPLDPNVIHPVVKVTVMFQDGEYMQMSSSNSRTDVEGEEDNQRRSDKKSKRQSKKGKNSDYRATPSTSTQKNSVLPIMSQPCHARHSIPTFTPTWNELLVFEEPFRRFAEVPTHEENSCSEPILFFEIMDFLPMPNNTTSNGGSSSTTVVFSKGFHGTELGWYKVAWAFLKPIGANEVMNLNRKLRLQLYKPVRLGRKEKVEGRPEVYSWWKSGRREKINNCTLYVTPKGIIPPETTRSASLRQLLSMRKEQLTQAILDSQLATSNGGKTKDGKNKQFSSHHDHLQREYHSWSRMEGQSCKPPNKLVASLPSSQIESLNIVISGNVYSAKFSPCGNFLACGLDTGELHVVLLFKVPSWKLLKTLKGHHGLIYDITWTIFQLDNNEFLDNPENKYSQCSSFQYHYMASASADSTVRIFRMKNCEEKSLSLYKVLYHPSYVYTVKFHPTHAGLAATGCFDFVIRIWDLKSQVEHEQRVASTDSKTGRKRRGSYKGTVTGSSSEASPIILLDKHSSFVNCLLFDHLGQHLFSGDGSACIFKWSCVSPTKKKSWRLEKDVKLHSGNIPVNSLDLHPSGTRLLVHLRDNFLKILDVVTFIPLQSFSGLHNERLQIRSCFSPCGNLVLSGSEDSTLCVWDADTGKILQLTSPPNHPYCVVSTVDYHPFDYYAAIGLASTISEPSPVLIYSYQGKTTPGGMMINYPVMLKRTAMKMRQSLEKSRSKSSLDAEEDKVGEVRKDRPCPPQRGDSSEKFISIIHKLDTALYFAQQRNKQRQMEAQSSACLSMASSDMEKAKKVESESSNQHQPVKYVKRKQIQERERPRSASSAGTRARRDRYKKSCEDRYADRDAKSDSEQTYQLKVIENAIVNENVDAAKMKPPKPMKRRSISIQQQNEQADGKENIENNNLIVRSQNDD